MRQDNDKSREIYRNQVREKDCMDNEVTRNLVAFLYSEEIKDPKAVWYKRVIFIVLF